MGASKRICPNCGRKMKQQFIGLFHCKCGTSWQRDIGFFERTPDMVFSLERKKVRNKVKQLPTIHHKIFVQATNKGRKLIIAFLTTFQFRLVLLRLFFTFLFPKRLQFQSEGFFIF